MSGDYSRKTFDSHDNFNGVRMQQGRVQLDADWNEQGDIQDRRWRAESVDVIGRCGCPDETPDAFRILNVGGMLTIGIGRMYVDGLLAENYGVPPLEFDRILAEERGTLPVRFDMQPYLPDFSAALPDPDSGFDADDVAPTLTPVPVLVYLDVWHREVTYLEDPELVEKAVGVDTTTRQQSVWQVRTLAGVGDIDCATPDADIPGWLDIITPSGGRLSSQGVGVSEPADPCLIPPSGGYRALENRLYRVEIHDGGATGTATFKWSRYNATIATRVTAIPDLDTLRVESTGRDDVLRFNSGDWVEIIDDHLELAGEPGIIRRIETVDDGTRTIVLSADLPTGVFPINAQDLTSPGRHTRVRRWDQSGMVHDTNGNLLANLDDGLSTGVIPLPPDGTSLVLEDGVQVSFDSNAAGGPVRTGDFWCIAARAADASVEELVKAPPADIHHHYCRLAVSVYDGENFIGTPTDCRDCFLPLTELEPGCCTVVVDVGQSIQAALDSLPPEGGCVCVKTGLHRIREPLRIEGSNIVLHGESPGSRIRNDTGDVLEIRSPSGALLSNIRVEGLRLVGGEDSNVIVVVMRCSEFSLVECAIIGPDRPGDSGFTNLRTGVLLADVLDGRIERCDIGPVAFGVSVGLGSSSELCIADNTFRGSAFLDLDADGTIEDTGGIMAISLIGAFGASRIERNQIKNFQTGISVNSADPKEPPTSDADGTQIVGNLVSRSRAPAFISDGHVFGIDIAARNCLAEGNVLDYTSPAYGGIRLSGAEGCVQKNTLHRNSACVLDGVLNFSGEVIAIPGEGLGDAIGLSFPSGFAVTGSTLTCNSIGFGSVGTMAKFFFNPLSPNPVNPFMTIGLYSYTLETVTTTEQSDRVLRLSGTGTMSAAGLTDKPYNFSLTAERAGDLLAFSGTLAPNGEPAPAPDVDDLPIGIQLGISSARAVQPAERSIVRGATG